MSSVLIDNWTIHNSVTLMLNRDLSPYVGNPTPEMIDDLENLVMSILLWDKVYFWDTQSASVWKSFSRLCKFSLPLYPAEIDSNTESLILAQSDVDLISGRVKQYQILANQLQIDYLPEKSREQYLGINWHSDDIRNINWQKYCMEQAKGAVLKYYDSLIGSIGDVELKFEFPLLLDYIISQSGSINNCISAAQEMRDSLPLSNMRLWINNLHKYVNQGNWIEVKNYINNVNDIVSTIEKHSNRKAKFSIGISPTGITPSFDMNMNLSLSSIEQHFQLTFLKDIVKFGLCSRPTKGEQHSYD